MRQWKCFCSSWRQQRGLGRSRGELAALMLAAAHGHLQCAQDLVAAEWKVMEANEEGTTSLMFSSLNGHSACVQYLAEKGYLINGKNVDDTTSLMLSAS